MPSILLQVLYKSYQKWFKFHYFHSKAVNKILVLQLLSIFFSSALQKKNKKKLVLKFSALKRFLIAIYYNKRKSWSCNFSRKFHVRLIFATIFAQTLEFCLEDFRDYSTSSSLIPDGKGCCDGKCRQASLHFFDFAFLSVLLANKDEPTTRWKNIITTAGRIGKSNETKYNAVWIIEQQ